MKFVSDQSKEWKLISKEGDDDKESKEDDHAH
jgi:hypothetical protein